MGIKPKPMGDIPLPSGNQTWGSLENPQQISFDDFPSHKPPFWWEFVS